MPLALPPVYPILDTASLEARNLDPVAAAEGILEAGARILQFRHKGFWGRDAFAAALTLATICDRAGALFVINDRADFAHLAGAALHLGQEDLLPADARAIVGLDTVIGFSTHNEAQLRAAEAEPVDYVAFGPVFSTASKDRPDPVVGVEGLRASRAFTRRPLVAIGGITRDNAGICWNAGADSVAVIADLFPIPATRQTLRERMAEWQQLINR